MSTYIIKRFITPIFLLLLAAAVLVGCTQEQIDNATTPVDTSHYPVVTLSYGAEQASIDNNVLTVPESGGPLFITATLSKAFDEQVIFLFELNLNPLDTTARVLNDFQLAPDLEDRDPRQPPNSFEVVFNPGVEEVSFNYVTLQNDNFYETDEEISFWVRPLLNSTINLPLHTLSKLPYVQLRIAESKSPPEIQITNIKIGNNNPQPAVSEITVLEGQSIELTIATTTSVNVENTLISFSLISVIPDEGAIDDTGYSYGFPFSKNKISPTDTSSEFTLNAEETSLSVIIPLYSKPIKEAPKQFVFSLISANNNAVISSSSYFLIVNINDDGNNGFDLSDTGITKCYDDLKSIIPDCIHSGYPNQDGITATQTQFSKYSNVNIAPDTTPPLADQTSWDCVYDQTTGLLWEVITEENKKTFYTWYDDNPTTNGGSSGVQIENDGNVLASISGSTLEHAASLNSSQLCDIGNANLAGQPGKWRLPTLNELLSIMNFESSGTLFVDNNLFKITTDPGVYFWTSSPSAISSADAWCVTFEKVIKDSIKLCEKAAERPAIMVSTVEISPL